MRLTAPASAGRLPAPAIWPRQSGGPLGIKRVGLCQRPLRLVIDVERFEQGGLIHHRLAADASTGARETVAIENIQIAVLLIPGFQILGADQIARIMVHRRSVAAIKT